MFKNILLYLPNNFILIILGWIFGNILQLQQEMLFKGFTYFILILISLFLLFIINYKSKIFYVLIFIILGFSITGLRSVYYQNNKLDINYQSKNILINGIIKSLPKNTENGQRFLFKVNQSYLNEELIKIPNLISLNIYNKNIKFNPGQEWQFTVRLKVPHGSKNPHNFDTELWHWQQGIFATGYVYPKAEIKFLKQTWQFPIEQLRHKVSLKMQEFQQNKLNEKNNESMEIINALVTGNQNAISSKNWQLFRDTGVAHLVVISGLHITMFAWIAFNLISFIWRRIPNFCLIYPAQLIASFSGLFLAFIYALFSGFGIPAQRTILMLATVIILRSFSKNLNWFYILLLALFIIIIFDPWAFLQAGFCLSFVCVAVLFTTQLKSDSQNIKTSKFINLIKTQIIISLILAPLTLILFGQISLIGLLANLIAIPLVTLIILPLSMVGVLFNFLWNLASYFINLMLIFLNILLEFPISVLYLAKPPLFIFIFGLLGCFILIFNLPWKLRFLGLPLIFPTFFWNNPKPNLGDFKLIFFDVGQGSSILIRTKNHNILFDSGAKWNSQSNAGFNLIIPSLRGLGFNLDLLILSHSDNDHTGGALSILKAYPNIKLIGSKIENILQKSNQEFIPCFRGQKWTFDNVDFEFLHPEKDKKYFNNNDYSCVLKITSQNNNKSALLTGDITNNQEKQLINYYPNNYLKTDILLAPHHGSKTSSSEEFIKQTQPNFVIFQAGWKHHYGHPHQIVIDRYKQQNILMFNNATCGAIYWQSNKENKINCERNLNKKYWQNPYLDFNSLN